ncbi:MAG: hypothetical protein ABI632_04120 [Pseudolysinimonas sp.]
MEILRNVLVVLHFVGLAAILGGALVQLAPGLRGKGRVISTIMHGAWLQLITGIALVGVIQGAHLDDINNTKIGVKLAVLIVIVVIAFVNRKKDAVARWVIPTIGGLALAIVVIAVFWH